MEKKRINFTEEEFFEIHGLLQERHNKLDRAEKRLSSDATTSNSMGLGSLRKAMAVVKTAAQTLQNQYEARIQPRKK